MLVADDNADMREYLGRILGTAYHVELVADGRAALDRIRAGAPDLVLADVMMPALDGFGLLAAIRADERSRSIPVVLLSARAGDEARIEGLQAGADEYLVKPFSARELLACVASQLQLARVRRETERALRHRGEQFQTLLNQAPLGVYVVDADFRIREMNPVALQAFGDVPGGVIGRDVAEVMHILWEEDDADEIVRDFRHTLATGEPHVAPELVARRHDRGVIDYYEWRLDRITLPDGRVRSRLLLPGHFRAEEGAPRRRPISRRSSTPPRTPSLRRTSTASSSRATRRQSASSAIRPPNWSGSRCAS